MLSTEKATMAKTAHGEFSPQNCRHNNLRNKYFKSLLCKIAIKFVLHKMNKHTIPIYNFNFFIVEKGSAIFFAQMW